MTNFISPVMKLVCIVLVFSSFAHAGFLEMFCKSKCNFGRGGNLCKCNGFHFAGKRTMSDKYLVENNPDLYKQYSMDREHLPQSDIPSSFSKEQEQSFNRLEEMELAKSFLKWLMASIDQGQDDNSDYLALKDELPIGRS